MTTYTRISGYEVRDVPYLATEDYRVWTVSVLYNYSFISSHIRKAVGPNKPVSFDSCSRTKVQKPLKKWSSSPTPSPFFYTRKQEPYTPVNPGLLAQYTKSARPSCLGVSRPAKLSFSVQLSHLSKEITNLTLLPLPLHLRLLVNAHGSLRGSCSLTSVEYVKTGTEPSCGGCFGTSVCLHEPSPPNIEECLICELGEMKT